MSGDTNTGVVHSANGYDELQEAAKSLNQRIRSDSQAGDPWWMHTPAHANVDAALNGTPHAEIPDALIDMDHIGHVPDHPGIPYPAPGSRIAMAGGGIAKSALGAFSKADAFTQAVRDAQQMRAAITARDLPMWRAKVANDLRLFGVQNTDQIVDRMLSEDKTPWQVLRESLSDMLDTSDKVNKMPTAYEGLVDSTSQQYDMPPAILPSVIKRESNWNPGAISKAGAIGIAQFMPQTAAGMGIDPTDPNQAIPAAGAYLKQLHDQFGSWKAALAAYNWGEGNLTRYGIGAIPPETQKYVDAILGKAASGVEEPKGPGAAIQRAKDMLKLQQQGAVSRGTTDLANKLTSVANSDKVASTQQPDDSEDPLLHMVLDEEMGQDPMLGLLDEGVDEQVGAQV